MPGWVSLNYGLEQPSGTWCFTRRRRHSCRYSSSPTVSPCNLLGSATCGHRLVPHPRGLFSPPLFSLSLTHFSLSPCLLLPLAVPVLAAQPGIPLCSRSHGMLEGAHAHAWEAQRWCEPGRCLLLLWPVDVLPCRCESGFSGHLTTWSWGCLKALQIRSACSTKSLLLKMCRDEIY